MTDQAPASPEREALTIHDGGCQCWPHVSQQDAVRAIEAVALAEYRDGLRRLVPAAQPSADVVGAVAVEAAAHLRAMNSGMTAGSLYGIREWLRELPERLAAAREAGPPAAAADAWQQGYEACWNRLNDAGRLAPAAAGWSAGGDFGVGIPGSKGYVPPHVAAEPADEGLRLLQAMIDWWDGGEGDGPAVLAATRAYLAAHPEPEGREE